jgi:hypothetical protein
MFTSQAKNAYSSEAELCKAFATLLTYLEKEKMLQMQTWFHVPNGQQGNKKAGGLDKAMGARRGVADYCMVSNSHKAHFMEAKHNKGRQSKEQTEFQASVYYYAVFYTLGEAFEAMEQWGLLQKGWEDCLRESKNPVVQYIVKSADT